MSTPGDRPRRYAAGQELAGIAGDFLTDTRFKLFSLKGVPDGEAEEIRELLISSRIDYYETPAGNWAVSAPAIWLNDESQWQKANRLIEQYQRERLIRVRQEYSQLQKEGTHRTIADLISENPIRFIVYLAAIAAIVYFSTKPFMNIGT